MSRYISDELRKFVAKRAEYRCEYCCAYERHSFLIEHIISLKHGGKSEAENLAFACPLCNINKGSDIATIIDSPNHPIRFFNPRTDLWDNHFNVEPSGFLDAKSKVGEATIKTWSKPS